MYPELYLITTIDKQVLKLKLIPLALARMLARRGHWCGRKPECPIKNPCVQAGDHHILSHTTSVDHGNRSWVEAVMSECVVHCVTFTSKFMSG